MLMHPNSHLWLVEQDRERAMTQRALERAARSGGSQRPGLVRGGIISFAGFLRRVAAAAVQLRPGVARRTSGLPGPSGV
jgi:hypothetical protein